METAPRNSDSARRRKRSRSRERQSYKERHDEHRSSHKEASRSQSPPPRRQYQRHRSHSPSHRAVAAAPTSSTHDPILLPNNASPLDHREAFKPYFKMFAKYLDIQKNTNITSLDEREVKDRFKRFISRWNRGELALGWYGKDMKVQADEDPSLPSYEEYREARDARKSSRRRGLDQHRHRGERHARDEPEPSTGMTKDDRRHRAESSDGEDVVMKDQRDDGDDGSSDDSDIGPQMPVATARRGSKTGPKPPTSQDLTMREEQEEDERQLALADLRYHRREERKAEKERLEDLVPRAEAGTRERQLEKKRENAATNRAFADAKAGGADVEVGESTLMGSNDSYKSRKAAMERKKNERELRKEALLLARKEEREERLAVHRAKEEQTMKMLKALADKFR